MTVVPLKPDGAVDVVAARRLGLTDEDVGQVGMLQRWLKLGNGPGELTRWHALRIPPDLWEWAMPGVPPVHPTEACEGMGI